ncbi:hypothetical protein EJ04DRAFT_568951 [Polyplosphaeria fusca]|uniref:Uncharacterized protein n=1 Tax=Polyplosphaeria fusca TaxID=682080 RepID=A0A9P4QQG3_9PLEO|nr:hypothetical protein EJ04DRAFT_568951 [Polyplosphaeria fusca]
MADRTNSSTTSTKNTQNPTDNKTGAGSSTTDTGSSTNQTSESAQNGGITALECCKLCSASSPSYGGPGAVAPVVDGPYRSAKIAAHAGIQDVTCARSFRREGIRLNEDEGL